MAKKRDNYLDYIKRELIRSAQIAKNAGADIREAAKLIQGGGGGQPGLATAGGKDIAGLGAALDILVSKI
jgi:alanyl-tRNA synthetase